MSYSGYSGNLFPRYKHYKSYKGYSGFSGRSGYSGFLGTKHLSSYSKQYYASKSIFYEKPPEICPNCNRLLSNCNGNCIFDRNVYKTNGVKHHHPRTNIFK